LGDKFNSGAKGQAQLIAIFLLLVLVPTTVIVAQNATNSTGVEGMVTDINLTETPPTQDILNETWPEPPEDNTTEPAEEPDVNATEPQDNATVPDDNVTTPEEPEINITEPDENVTLPEDNVTIPEENVTIPDENATNITEPDDNVTIPEEPEINITEPDENITEEETGEPEIYVLIDNPDRITRGNGFILSATVMNEGDVAENVVLEFILPEGFSADSTTVVIGTLGNGEGFMAELLVYTDSVAARGMNDIRVSVSYE